MDELFMKENQIHYYFLNTGVRCDFCGLAVTISYTAYKHVGEGGQIILMGSTARLQPSIKQKERPVCFHNC